MQQTCNKKFMLLALEQAQLAYAHDEVPIGAVIVKDQEVIAQGYNQTIASHDPSAHAEIVCLRQAGQLLRNYRLNDCQLYVTIEPCAMCVGALVHARIAKVFFGANEEKTGALVSAHNLAQQQCFNHKLAFEPGILAAECASIMQDFFRDKRIAK
jgi:tRNA(adenine34) deaminase